MRSQTTVKRSRIIQIARNPTLTALSPITPDSQPDFALADYNKTIEINPYFANAYNNRGLLYHAKNEPDRAIADYSKAIEINPKYANAYFSRGLSYRAKGDNDRSKTDINKAIELDPRLVTAR